jgi:oxygen-independent coproporphyrinogen-3 oxidase
MDPLGAYVHIPFCIQRCHYCDFATYARDQIAANDDYVDRLCIEIEKRRTLYEETKLHTIYFGGGTPSLLEPQQIQRIINQYKKVGFSFTHDIEITLEVNPATLTENKCEGYVDAGVNRISLGCQSFNDNFLKACHREHTADDTRNTIRIVKRYFPNFSLDLLFSLPKQGLENVIDDVDEMISFNPPHISAYCLTVPEQHPMNQGRANEEDQILMFEKVISKLEAAGLMRYELSNFCRPGFESRHNNLYWTDKNYWGVGLSAHSYRSRPGWGYRFWNPSSYKAYMELVDQLVETPIIEDSFEVSHLEKLSIYDSLTDFCHTHLRMTEGLPLREIEQKFGGSWVLEVQKALHSSVAQGWVVSDSDRFSLTEAGFLASNQVFQNLLFTHIDKPESRPLF